MHSYPLPPASPTCYLTPEQRAHLMKSTRKLAKVLGTTPVLRVAPATRQHGEGDIATAQYALVHDHLAAPIFASAPATPMSSPTGHWTSADAQARDEILRHAPHLHFLTEEPCKNTGLRALTSPNTLAYPAARLESLVTPSSTTARRASFFPATPVSASGETDTARIERERRLQRKRLSKLARTFGQTIPPALVAPARRPVSRQRSIRNRRALIISLGAANAESPIRFPPTPANSLEDVREETPQSTVYAPLPETWQAMHLHQPAGASEPASENEDNAQDVPAETLASPPSAPLRFRPISMELQSPEKSHLPRSCSIEILKRLATEPGHLEADSEASETEEEERARMQEELPSRSSSRIALIFNRRLAAHEARSRAMAHAHRSERRQGWSGEWNAASVQDVIARLRELK